MKQIDKLIKLFDIDCYKLVHNQQYPEGTTLLFSSLTPRENISRDKEIRRATLFGLQAFIKKLVSDFDDALFSIAESEIDNYLEELRQIVISFTGLINYDITYLRDLYDIGYLPLSIRAIAEGESLSFGFPLLTINNTTDNTA
jgi:nicotinamide phosphoribosyltransferase